MFVYITNNQALLSWINNTSCPGVNFISILQAAFTCADPESAKKTVKLSVFFALLGSTHAKADRRMLMNLTLCIIGLHASYIFEVNVVFVISDFSILRKTLFITVFHFWNFPKYHSKNFYLTIHILQNFSS